VVAEAVENLVADAELSKVSTDEVGVSDSEDELLPSPCDAFSSDKDFEALRLKKCRHALQALRNYVHSSSPTAHQSTSEAEIAITASLKTVIAISCAVDEAIANSEASGGISAIGSTTDQG